uniref:olfactory receptor 56B1-like n=1 Tax=Panthera onca TaxID=9690 RepID=UPI0029539341|nr:olfactory receptor 56B1-like [Panthera onca]
MSASLKGSNSSKFQVSEFILMGLPGIHSWQHWLSLPLALLYLSAIGANILILVTICQDPALQQPMYSFLGILSVVDMGLATTIMPKILAIFWFDAKVISLPECFAQIYAIHCFVSMESGIFLCMAFDRYIAICHPLRYPSIVTKALILRATVFMVLRNSLFVPVLLNVLHNIIPPSLNPMVYALRTKELRAGFQKVFCLSLEKKTRHQRPSP